MDSGKKLQSLRSMLNKHALAAYVQPVHDEYMSEYPPACNRRVEWLAGFSGSAGTAVVAHHKAALFVDGRYTLQAKNEVSSKLFEQHNSGDLLPETWLANHLKAGDKVGYDPKLYTASMTKRMQAVLAAKDITLVPVENLVDAIWQDRPSIPSSPLMIHEMKYAGEGSSAKRKRIAEQLTKAQADAAMITAPDAVNWLLNIRGNDVEHTPLALCFSIIEANARVKLYVSSKRCSSAVRKHLGSEVDVLDPAALEKDMRALGKNQARVWCDPASVPVWFTQKLSEAGATIIERQDPTLLPKAMKNKTELQGMRNAHIRDGAAVVKLLCWLDKQSTRRQVKETEVSDKLLEFRSAHALFSEPSFTTIAGSGPHGAIVHYRVTPQSDRILKKGELFLLDSGGQYPDGTTDITRTLPIGKPTKEHKECFTRVLKGHIAIALAAFPEGTSGSQLDALARQYLWQAGLDYDHGTGHGVGCFLNVHEGPQRISKRGGDAPLQPGMIISNEPGYYKTGAFGIRIENLVAVTPKAKGKNGKAFFGFETITCASIDTRLVEKSMLMPQEKTWLNTYHAWVYQSLYKMLTKEENAWLKARCAKI